MKLPGSPPVNRPYAANLHPPILANAPSLTALRVRTLPSRSRSHYTFPSPPMLTLLRIFVSPGHSYFGRHGHPPAPHGMIEVPSVECFADRGLAGDRFLDYKENYKGQVTLFADEVWQQLLATRTTPADTAPSPAALRRNLLVRGADLNDLIGSTFCLQDIELQGVEECRPCYWMDSAVRSGTETWLRGRGGLRCRILTDGVFTATSFAGTPPLLPR